MYGDAMAYPGGGIPVVGHDPDTVSIHACLCAAPNKPFLALILRSGMTSHVDV